jgi:hypothetical protein
VSQAGARCQVITVSQAMITRSRNWKQLLVYLTGAYEPFSR